MILLVQLRPLCHGSSEWGRLIRLRSRRVQDRRSTPKPRHARGIVIWRQYFASFDYIHGCNQKGQFERQAATDGHRTIFHAHVVALPSLRVGRVAHESKSTALPSFDFRCAPRWRPRQQGVGTGLLQPVQLGQVARDGTAQHPSQRQTVQRIIVVRQPTCV